jgi:3-phosphoshikimate 1-carboxyvinyltransferase
MNPRAHESEHSNRDCVLLEPLKGPVPATVTVPGSKSYTIRALLLAALTPKVNGQPVKVLNPLSSDDGQAILNCLNALGIRTTIKEEETGRWIEIHNDVNEIQPGDYDLDANLSAATLRFLLALSAVIPGRQTLFGKAGLNNRPVRDLVDSLRAIGADIQYLEREGYPPVRVNSSRIDTCRLQVSGATSSQYISALMMIAPQIQAQNGGQAITIELLNDPVSKPYLDMTASIMRDFGVTVENRNYTQFVIPQGQAYQTASYAVEPDASSMAYFLAIAALTGSSITIQHLNPQSVQADMRFVQILQTLGHRVEWRGQELTLHGQPILTQSASPLLIDMEDCPDQAQTMAVLAAFMPCVTRIEGLQSLRVKETDRLAATASELAKMGIHVDEEADALMIHGGQPKAASIATYGDHRMAMAFAVAGAKMCGLQIEDPAVVNKTYPDFWTDLRKLGVGVQPLHASDSKSDAPEVKSSVLLADAAKSNIVLIGFMGAGKSAVAQLLAQSTDLELVEMDAEIVKRSGRASVTEIFDCDGEARFRTLETEVAQELSARSNLVISCGGGVVMNEANMQALAENGTVVFLEAQLDTILARLADADDRPLLRDKQQFEQLFALRQPLYRQFAQLIVVTDEAAGGQSSQQVASSILQALGKMEISPVCPV